MEEGVVEEEEFEGGLKAKTACSFPSARYAQQSI